MRRIAAAALVCLLAGIALPVQASSITVSPVRITIEPGQRAATLTVTNQGDSPVIVQIEGNDWSQQNGEEVITPTSDLIISPPVMRLAGGGKQIVRLGPKRAQKGPVERTYRLYVTEVPQDSGDGRNPVKLRLRMSLPLFLPPASRLNYLFQYALQPDGLRITNQGNTHVMLRDLKLRDDRGRDYALEVPGVTYVLPGAYKVIPMPDALIRNRRLRQVTMNTREGKFTGTLIDAR